MDLSVIIPARNEEFLPKTIDSVLSAAKADTEVIAVMDGYWTDVSIPDDERIKIIHYSEPIGQRAACNAGVRLSDAKYVMKLDAHCSLDDGFDVKLMADMQPDWVVVPRMYVLDAFHWKCNKCGKEFDQGPARTYCDGCNSDATFEKKIIWEPKRRKKTDYMWFTPGMNTKYFDTTSLKDYGRDINALKQVYSHKIRPWADGEITDVMCGIGACWFLERERYNEFNFCDENYGSWGAQGAEVALKAWLSGGSYKVNKKTWFAHLCRTQLGFSWPYPMKASDQKKARDYGKNLFLNDKWPLAKRKISWLIDKFGPLPEWDAYITPKKDVSKGLVYYTDNRPEERLLSICRDQVKACANGHKIVSVSQYPISFGENIVVREPRGVLTMFKQILAGLEAIDSDVVFLVEHDVIYHPSHFEFVPEKEDVFYYNENVWKLCSRTGQALFYHAKQTAEICAYRALLLEHYRKRVERVEKEGFTRRMGFEPGTHSYPRGIDNYKSESFWSEYPNIDVRHTTNLTENRFRKDQFRSHRSIRGWKLADEIPGWGKTKGRYDEFLNNVSKGCII